MKGVRKAFYWNEICSCWKWAPRNARTQNPFKDQTFLTTHMALEGYEMFCFGTPVWKPRGVLRLQLLFYLICFILRIFCSILTDLIMLSLGSTLLTVIRTKV